MNTDHKRALLHFALSDHGNNDCIDATTAPDDEGLAAYIDGSMPSAQIATCKSHLANCHFCYQRFSELESTLSTISLTKTAASASSSTATNASIFELIKSHWSAITTGLSSAVAVAFVAFIFVGSPTSDLTTSLRGDLNDMVPYSQWPESEDEFTKGVNTNLEVSEETSTYISIGFADGLKVLAPHRQTNLNEMLDHCINHSDTESCSKQQRWAYNVGLWLVLTETFCQNPSLNENNAPINLSSLSKRLSELRSVSDSSLLINIDTTSAQSLCEDNGEILESLGLQI